MSDETRTALTQVPTLDEHYCEHPGCKKWGGFGYETGSGRERKAQWFCFEHRWHEYPSLSVAPDDRDLACVRVAAGGRR